MTPSEHLDSAEAVALTALNIRGSVTRRAALLDVAALHLKAAEVQAIRLSGTRQAAPPPPKPRAQQEHDRVMALEREALVQQIGDDMAAVRGDAARIRRLV
jgi:hypothetical protein